MRLKTVFDAVLQRRSEWLSRVRALLEEPADHLCRQAVEEHGPAENCGVITPAYVADVCDANCRGCGYAESVGGPRRVLKKDEMCREMAGHAECIGTENAAIIVLTGSYKHGSIDDIYSMVWANAMGCQAAAEAGFGVILESSPFTRKGFQEILEAMPEAARATARFTLFQETWDRDRYRAFCGEDVPENPKGNPEARAEQHKLAFEAGWRHAGVGVLLGLGSDIANDIACTIAQAHVLREMGYQSVTISIPRLVGGLFPRAWRCDDETFKKAVAIYRLLCPWAKILITARETAEMRDEIRNLCHITGVSGTTKVGGRTVYPDREIKQFGLSDTRTREQLGV